MSFNNFAELQDLIRSYNSKSILEIGTRICWENFYIQQKSQQFDWFFYNAERNSAIRLMLLASMSNPHRKKNILEAEFNEFKYFFLNEKKLNHTIAYSNVLRQEAETISRCIKSWENNPKNIKKVSNWLLKPSDFFDVKVIDGETNYLFMQRQVAFRGEGFGNLKARILRTIKFIEFLESYSNREFGESYLKSNFLKSTGLSIDIYFRQFWGCLALFKRRDGYFDFSHFPGINQVIQEMGITIENLKLFIKQNSAPFHSESENSFRSKVSKKLQNTSEFYKPFFYNFFLEKPFVEFSKDQFYLPDPFSLIESCWNQIESSILENWPEKKRSNILSNSFEEYLEKVLLPFIAQSFNKIPEVENSKDPSDKRADFLIELSQFYIVLECKNSLMSLDTSKYFDPEGIAELWCRTHLAVEQIAATVKAIDIKDKPVIPVILTFYDSMASSLVLREIIMKNSNYCDIMGLNIPPIVYSLHEFEEWTSNRSLDNLAKFIPKTHNNPNVYVEPDNQGHNYQHLADIQLL